MKPNSSTLPEETRKVENERKLEESLLSLGFTLDDRHSEFRRGTIRMSVEKISFLTHGFSLNTSAADVIFNYGLSEGRRYEKLEVATFIKKYLPQ